jgi:acyl-CoA dehydrogenase
MLLLLSFVLILLLLGGLFYYQVALPLGSGILLLAWLVLGFLSPVLWSLWLVIPLAVVLLVLNLPGIRRPLLSRRVFKALSKVLPPMSQTEAEALEAGSTWWEKDLFSGRPDWHQFAEITLPQLTAEEQSFLDNEVNELCAMLDEWDIQHTRKDLSPEAWQYLKDKGFLGLIIPKEFGGRDFTPYAQSRVMSKIASRSVTAAVTAMVPNSLGPGELLVKYGTEEQKQRWLPGLANGTEIPCFGLTGPEAGSDAGSIPDAGIVCMGEFEGKEVLGLKLTFNKRWITLAPVATVVGLAFKLYDPDGLLGDKNKTAYGITCALLPADLPGVEIGRRHNPGSPFMNGPISGEDVFIPVDWIIGGAPMAGKGWRMLIECLGAGRGISLPSMATASGEMCYLTVGAYARIRRQFNMEVGKFEGVQEATAEIAAGAYMLEAMRQLVTKGLDQGKAPSVVTSMAKYHATEMMRRLVNHGMDVVGGRAIQMGPRNFLALPYQSIPVGITVEGANILTRSLMIFGQGAVRCHPYLLAEMEAMQNHDSAAGLKAFDQVFFRHVGHVLSNSVRTKLFGLTRARFSPVPENADNFSRRWYQRINLLSAALAVSADTALGVLGGNLKRRELLSARLGDVLSQLFIACSILKFHSSHPRTAEEDAHAHHALTLALYSAQEALYDFYDNFPSVVTSGLKWMTFPWGRIVSKPSDDSIRTLGDLIMEDNPVRKELAAYLYVTHDPDDATGRVEHTYQLLLALGSTWSTFARAQANGELKGDTLSERLQDAATKGIIQTSEIDALKEYDACRYDCLLTDAFDSL